MSIHQSERVCHFCSPPPTEFELAAFDDVRVAVLTGVEVPGWLVIHPLEHITSWAQMPDDTGAAMIRAMRMVSQALMDYTRDERIYCYAMGEKKPHLHVLIGSPYFVAVGDVGRGAPVLDAVLFRTRIDVAASLEIATNLRPHLTSEQKARQSR